MFKNNKQKSHGYVSIVGGNLGKVTLCYDKSLLAKYDFERSSVKHDFRRNFNLKRVHNA